MDEPLTSPPPATARLPMDRQMRGALIAIAVIAALIVLVIFATRLADRVFGGPKPETIASSSLESMRAQNRLVTFVARYVSVTSSTTSRFGLSSQRTLILPGNVRYEVDLAKLQPSDVRYDDASKTLSIQMPEIEIAGPEVDLAAAREYGDGGILSALTNADERLNSANRAAAVNDLRSQAKAKVPMQLAREAAREAVERNFGMPLKAAGFDDIKVVARFASEGVPANGERITASRSYNEVLNEPSRQSP